MSARPLRLKYALYGGVVTGATIGVPVLSIVNCLCCAGVMLGGFLAVFLYTRDYDEGVAPLTNTDAIQLGALSGVFGAVTGSIFQLVFTMLAGDALREEVASLLQESGILDQLTPGELRDQIGTILMSGEEVTFLSVLASLVIWMFFGPLFGLLGGLIGFSLFKPKTPTNNSLPPPLQAPQ
jgi:hypothetical protein